MNEWGFKVRNTSGGLVIDSTYRNHELLAEGSATLRSDAQVTTVEFSPQVETPMVALRLLDTPVACVGFRRRNGYFDGVFLLAPQAVTVQFMVFVPSEPAPDGGHGLQVFSSDGDLVYDSNRRYLKLMEVAELDGDGHASHQQGSSPWYITGTYGGYLTTYHDYESLQPRWEEVCEWRQVWVEKECRRWVPGTGESPGYWEWYDCSGYEPRWVCEYQWVNYWVTLYRDDYYVAGLRRDGTGGIRSQYILVDSWSGMSEPYDWFRAPMIRWGPGASGSGGGRVPLVEVQL